MKKIPDEDMIGKRVGRLVVVGEGQTYYKPSGQAYYKFLCKCDCGNTKMVNGYALRKGLTKSCGCYTKEKAGNMARTHGKSDTKLYTTWVCMRSRCNYKRNKEYKDYGGRGIKVCKEWDESFDNFCAWAMENGYKEGLSIDRIDVNGNYEPSNCKWATRYEQDRNKRNNVMITYNGETKILRDWEKYLGMSKGTLRQRIKKHGWSIEKAFTTPVKNRNSRSSIDSTLET